MPYTKRPFQPETPYTNQVSIELNKANDNFDILSQVFVSNNPETFKVKEADTVDGFHASLTPGPNVIVPLNTSGVLDLSGAYVKSNVYTFRRVDLTGASQDYALQVGEEAYISFSDTTSVLLRIATPNNSSYELFVLPSNTGGTSGGTFNPIYLNPNNTTYTNAFVYAEVVRLSDGAGASYIAYSAFRIGRSFSHIWCTIMNRTQIKSIVGIYNIYGTHDAYPGITFFATNWRDTTTAWTSLGTIVFPQNTSGEILVRRVS